MGLALAVACFGATAASADTIFLTAGNTISGVRITGETYKEISYKDGSKNKTVKADKVLRVEFTSKSTQVDQAETSAADGQLYDAIAEYEAIVERFAETGRTRTFAWEPAYALNRLIELNREVGDAEHLIAAADQLIAKIPDSGYVPTAFLAKAETQFLTGEAAAATKTLADFQILIQSQALSGRWRIEHKLAGVLFGSKEKGKALRSKLDAISNEAGSSFPIVSTRADVAIAESLITDKQFSEAEPIFKDVSENPASGVSTLAAAYTGLGDCLIKRAVATTGTEKFELLQDARLAYLRVVVVYKSESRYVPKAMFWAGRAFDESTEDEDKASAQRLYKQVMRDYKGSEWATEAKQYIKR
jgi:tetratricopeptide (TPR) repeat protein